MVNEETASKCSMPPSDVFHRKYQEQYAPIEEHGLIGNMHTCALVSTDGTIDFYCYPSFDSPSIFASMLDKDKGGFFSISVGIGENEDPVMAVTNRQMYVPDSNVLITRFMTSSGVGQITDFMPVKQSTIHGHEHGYLVRELEVVRGKMCFQVECVPRFDYAREEHELQIVTHGARFKGKELSMVLTSTHSWDWREHPTYKGGVIAEITLTENDREAFIFRESFENRDDNPFMDRRDSTGHPACLKETDSLKTSTLKFWRKWISKSLYKGRWREMVNRSALALKLMTYEPTGAIVAAPTFAFPESLGGHRNWDYRFTWIRDSSFVLYAFLKLGFTDEALAFLAYIEERCNETTEEGKLQIMYGLRGEHHLEEKTLDHLSGYKDSAPVRIGNGAFDQLQLDIYGELMDTLYLADKYTHPIAYSLWKHCQSIVNYVCKNWRRKDEGVWEVRGGQQHFTYSKVMCWVAVDRAIRLAAKRSLPADIHNWRLTRDAIYEEIQEKAWCNSRQTFVQAFGSDTLDASCLIMPLVLFQSPMDPRVVKTVDAIYKNIEDGGLTSNGLVFRYDLRKTDDGLSGEEGTFSICTFWMVEALARIGKHDKSYLDKARWLFEQMISYSNHVGLYSEEIGMRGEALGNFPQAFTHLSLISAAVNLNRVIGE